MNRFVIKLVLALLLLLVALVAGLYLSAQLLPMLLKVQPQTPWYDTWWRYYRAIDLPQVRPHAFKIKLATGIGVPLLAYCALLVLILRGRDKDLHGQARFATAGELARKKMMNYPAASRGVSEKPKPEKPSDTAAPSHCDSYGCTRSSVKLTYAASGGEWTRRDSSPARTASWWADSTTSWCACPASSS